MQGFGTTPKTIKWLIITTSVISLLNPLLSYFITGAALWLPLSLYGLSHHWFWQLITYFFIQSAGATFSLSLLISLFFAMFLLWFSGKEIVRRFGTVKFLLLYLVSGIVAGLIGALCLYLFNDQTPIMGSNSALFAVLTVFAMLYADMHLYYFFIFRLQAKVLIGILFALPLVLHLAHGDFALFFTELTGIVSGYIFGLTLFGLKPLITFPAARKTPSKTIDITTLIDDDEAFMDRMLAKIAKLGESSLSASERARMDSISKKKR